MSLFKVNRGNEANLPAKLTDGWAYFCTDTGSFLIDHYDSTNTLIRSKINAEYADKLRYVQNEEPVDAPDGTLWIDLDAEGFVDSGGTSVFIDTTLTVTGAAADAKAVGDAINQILEEKADKAYMVQLFEELKTLIQSGNTESAIAVLDEAILDLTRLA